jgi:DNA-binding GntR family transcriptional regulator
VVVPLLSHADLEELLRLRLAVESFAFVSAAPHHRAADWRRFNVLQADVCRAAELDEPTRFAAAVWSLRVVLLELARPSVLAMLADRIWCRFGPTFAQMMADAERRRQVTCHLGKIVRGIGNHDLEEARRALLDEIDAGTVPCSSNIADKLPAPPIVPSSTTTCRMLAADGKSGADHV